MNSRMVFSNYAHLVKYNIKKPNTFFKKGKVLFSIDVDVADKRLDTLNNGKNSSNVHKYFSEYKIGELEESMLPLFLDSFGQYNVPATFAIRGQLGELDLKAKDIFGTTMKHDLGAHGYYHKSFDQLTLEQAEEELTLTSQGMSKLGIKPTSFIFPKNRIKHLNLLPKYGYTCYRPVGTLKHNSMRIKQEIELLSIYPSIYLNRDVSLFVLKGLLKTAINKKGAFHLWFHLWNFGLDKSSVSNYLQHTFNPFLLFIRENVDQGKLDVETMASLSQQYNTFKRKS